MFLKEKFPLLSPFSALPFYSEFFIIKDNHIRLIWHLTHAQMQYYNYANKSSVRKRFISFTLDFQNLHLAALKLLLLAIFLGPHLFQMYMVPLDLGPAYLSSLFP